MLAAGGVLLSGLAACVHPVTRAALSKDLAALDAELDRAEREGDLGRSEVVDLAEAVLSREIVAQTAATDFPDTDECAHRVRPALERAAAGVGETAGLAAVALVEAGLPVPSDAKSPILTARRAIGVSAGPRRRASMLDGDAHVRRAALRAAIESADPADTPALLEAARLDPDLQASLIAIDALARIGGSRVVLGLGDLWPNADAERRQAIVRAWSLPASARAGGERELVRVAEQEADGFAVLAAVELARAGLGPPGFAEVTLVRLMSSDDVAARLSAIYRAPSSSPNLRAALARAARSEHAATRVFGLLRAIELGAIDAAGILELRKLAAAREGGEALVARAALARAGDRSVAAGLRADLSTPRAEQRTLAGLSLFALEEWPAAARAVADDSPAVRQTIACHLLSPAANRSRSGAESARARAFGPFADDLTALMAPAQD